ncbi:MULTISPECIES: hypothetical protein [unclassified Streptomyces]|uniref:hypothetical protein n=1 Tax=unclassified Streptomyces TaxID=2593676 RepID=UPI00166017DA|nr:MULTISPECIES: hypothetical protein [unclassified Streptomyces]MBD0710321.1 hypothetical protein [Streptomyces sp. CBMA291]MBD0717288.1 hypothetical protein [Streptomyces sp. CBMA370]
MSSRSSDAFPCAQRPYDSGRGAAEEPEDPHELLYRARRLTAEGHPEASASWERAATALRHAGGNLAPGDHADALDAAALGCRETPRADVGPLFTRAADLHEQAGQRGKALVSRARALLSGAGPGATARAALDELHERAEALYVSGRASVAETATVRLLRDRAAADLLDTAPDPTAEAAALRAELTGLVAFAVPHAQDPAVSRVLADTRALLGRVTAPDDPAAALVLLRTAVAGHRFGGRSWCAVEHELLLAAVLRATGARAEAVALLRAALAAEEPAAPLRPGDRTRLLLALVRALAPTGATDAGGEEVSLLAEAVRHSEGPGPDLLVDLFARLGLGVVYAQRGRVREAAPLLERALTGFAGDDETAERVRAGAWLAYCVLLLGEPGRAAREYTRAAEAAESWDDRRHAAALHHRAGYAFETAGAPGEAARAYERAAGIRRPGGGPAAEGESRGLGGSGRVGGTVGGDAGTGPGGGDGGGDGSWAGLRDLPEAGVPVGRYQMNVYGEVGGVGPRSATVPGTRVRGCV